jgi:hypothetical protein
MPPCECGQYFPVGVHERLVAVNVLFRGHFHIGAKGSRIVPRSAIGDRCWTGDGRRGALSGENRDEGLLRWWAVGSTR